MRMNSAFKNLEQIFENSLNSMEGLRVTTSLCGQRVGLDVKLLELWEKSSSHQSFFCCNLRENTDETSYLQGIMVDLSLQSKHSTHLIVS